jgi:signal transduction histidine kinase
MVPNPDGSRFIGKIEVMSEPAELRSEPGVNISVSDNGPGIPAEIREKIFEDFFTTKPAGQGTGLGLSLSIKIVEEHGGTLNVDTSPTMGGARFTLWVPAAGGNLASADQEPNEGPIFADTGKPTSTH